MRQILKSDQVTGDVFYLDGAAYFVGVWDHAGGTWAVQVRDPGDATAWRDLTDQEFPSDGVNDIQGASGLAYRLSGGTIGARGYLMNAHGLDMSDGFRLPGGPATLVIDSSAPAALTATWTAPTNLGSATIVDRYLVKLVRTVADPPLPEITRMVAGAVTVTIAIDPTTVASVDVRAETRIGRGAIISADV